MRAKVNQNINLEDYKGIYVIGEQIEGEIHPVTVELIGEAKKLASDTRKKLTVVIAGYGVEENAKSYYIMKWMKLYIWNIPC